MKLLLSATLLAGAAAFLGAAEPEGFKMWTAAEAKSQVMAAKLDEHKVGSVRVGTWGNHGLMFIRREGDGEAEIHDTQADVIFITEGAGSMIIGGEVVGGKTTAPGETRGTSIKGGETKKMAVGDVFHIPAKVPHQMLVPKFVSFKVVKVDTK